MAQSLEEGAGKFRVFAFASDSSLNTYLYTG